MPRHITFYDTTLRDGEQTPYVHFTPDQKIFLALQLEKMGMDIIEAGFPAASETEYHTVCSIGKELTESTTAALARCRIDDVERTAEALSCASKARLSIVLPVSRRHLKNSLKIDRTTAEQWIDKAVRRAVELMDDVEFIATDATRTDYDLVLSALQIAANAGAQTLVVADTVGVAVPHRFGKQIGKLVKDMGKDFPDVGIGVHCHNDFGLATANSLEGLRAGAVQVEGTINGLGERAGNAALEEIAVFLRYHHKVFNLTTSIRTREILETSMIVSEYSNVGVQPNKALVGRHAFLHAAGMHQQAMLRDPLTFEAFDPEMVGAEASLEDRIIFGKFIGRNGLRSLLKQEGFDVSEDELDRLVTFVRSEIDQQRTVMRKHLREMVAKLN